MATGSPTRKSANGGAKADRLLREELARRLARSVLPGDGDFTAEALDAAATFLLDAADDRRPGQPVIAIESVTGAAADRFMRVAVINDDMPFLVDSIAATVTAQGLGINRLVHPVLAVRRDAEGHLAGLPEGAAAAGEKRESMVYLETGRADARTRRALRESIADTLADVRAAVADWPKMQAAMAEDADGLGDAEGAALLRWLKDGMLTQLGHETRHRDGSRSHSLGICRKGALPLLGEPSYKRAFEWFDKARKGARVPLVIKSNRISTVHRHVPLDLFIVPLYEQGKVSALSIHAGVWTSAALAAAPTQVPRMRAQLAELTARFGFDPSGHAGKALVHAMTSLPHDLLISFDDADLERVCTSMMSLIDRPRPRLSLVTAPLERHLFAFVWLPRDAMSTATRLQVQSMLTHAADGPVLDWSLEVEGGNLALLQFVIDIREGAAIPDETALDAQLKAMLRGWGDAVEAELARFDDAGRAAAIAARYAEAFPLAYRATHGAAEAANDIARLRHLAADEGEAAPRRGVRLYAGTADAAGHLRLKLYQRSGAIALSDAVPALENFGFRVIEDVPTTLKLREEHLGAIHDFLLALPAGQDAAEVLAHAPVIEDALAAVLNGAGEDDGFNRLIAALRLSAREANWLRAWYRYLRQAGMNFGVPTVVDALQNAPAVTLAVLDLFRALHDPAFAGDRTGTADQAQEAIKTGLAGVSAINDDRLLRAYRALVLAMLRTNAFAPAGAAALAFKLDSAQVPGLPKPLPWREIFVYSRRVEGIHLRAGPVARGGLRWSDRRDDFRTEILGLMKAQRVKNAVIVPTGAKGGFYPKQLPNPAVDRDGWLAEGKESYKLFIRTLLSITDNIVGSKVVHPAGVVIRDGEDPYFVVAADKGTATFSDTANALAEEADFWLDDAFASGGSKGYDHKAMGITARGAWLSVRRHFLEMGVDVQSEPVRVAGCGDMSGDVFGNGMLLSKAIKLVAAFDHRHIFLDPDPDPARSHAERARLFALPRSSWDDYDKTLISAGGGVFPRSAKEVPLSAPVRAMLGTDAEVMDPESLISAILKSPVDLLWFGGIGTYVKSSAENNATVGDPGNDALRVDARDIGARVIGEGANLGCTQAGRIEFALSGGRINTDFIDNSAGVDCSDNEVNIKIALASAKRAGRLNEAARVKLLAGMTDAVAHLVLEDNRLQALGLSIAEAGGAAATGSYLRLMEMLEERGQLDRRTEGLADNDSYKRRAAEGQGLSRPELAVLLSSAKLALQDSLEHSQLPDDPGLDAELLAAFPEDMRTKFRKDILGHRLRREIIATKLANRMVNRIGMIHPFELVEEEGGGLAQVAAAFLVAEKLFGMDAVWQQLESATMPEGARLVAFRRASSALRSHMADLLRAGVSDRLPSKALAELAPGVSALDAQLSALLAGEARTESSRFLADLTGAGVPGGEAAMVARLHDLDGSVGLARLARDLAIDAGELTRAFSDLGARLGLDWAQQAASRLRPSDSWERLLVAGLARDFQHMRLDFLRRLCTRKGCDPIAVVATWAADQATAIRQFRAMVTRAQAAIPTAPAMLAQIAGQARNLLGR
ncbi:NAD-glutamate dehydrogenase domain-containing protein [Novosphingobium sp. TH158]|uniref:NAD-glutamate dehydrogenase n=1 Tax=Novosphingobium sp. TH158 TaxID=2067455 RepID=UPI000C79E74A|nr:NAD-glutamate dehydrogenase domain-containing protein [Novosphingobium sp. TH158]PLK27131.1 glutamate dehydrogenase [Novosphingobium sp. TH158]